MPNQGCRGFSRNEAQKQKNWSGVGWVRNEISPREYISQLAFNFQICTYKRVRWIEQLYINIDAWIENGPAYTLYRYIYKSHPFHSFMRNRVSLPIIIIIFRARRLNKRGLALSLSHAYIQPRHYNIYMSEFLTRKFELNSSGISRSEQKYIYRYIFNAHRFPMMR